MNNKNNKKNQLSNRNNGRINQNNGRSNRNNGNNKNKMANIPDNNSSGSGNVLTNENSGWCMPTIIYVVLFSITLVINLFQDPYNNENKNIAFKINLISHHLLYGLIFTIIIYLLCKQGYVNTAWIVLLLPMLLFIVFFVIFMLGFSFRLLGNNGQRMMSTTSGSKSSSSGLGATDNS
jgi:hypothetical protein